MTADLFAPGKTVGQWTLIEVIPGNKKVKPAIAAKWRCRCSCGVERLVNKYHIENALSKSCGHDRQERNKRAIAVLFPKRKQLPPN